MSFCAVVYLAALQDIPPELVEAASIDGARRAGVLRHVIAPALTPVTIFLLLWQTVQGVQLFDLVYAGTSGGPGQSTYVVVYYVYRTIRDSAYGTGAAASYVVAGGLLLISLTSIAVHRLRERRA